SARAAEAWTNSNSEPTSRARIGLQNVRNFMFNTWTTTDGLTVRPDALPAQWRRGSRVSGDTAARGVTHARTESRMRSCGCQSALRVAQVTHHTNRVQSEIASQPKPPLKSRDGGSS